MTHRFPLTLLAWALFALPAAAQPPSLDSEHRFEIPAQTLETALLELSRQGSFQLVLSAGTMPQQTAPALSGQMTVRAALDALLRDTGLSYKWRGDHTVTVTARDQDAHGASTGAVPPASEASLRLAQAEAAGAVQEGASGVDEVVVRGTQLKRYESTGTSIGRLDEDVRNIARMVQVIPEQVILDQGVQDLQEAVRNVAGITPADGFGGTLDDFFVRGFALGQIYRNGVRLITPNKPPTQNIESIEVLKGPSVLYGQGEPGGLVNVNTKRPTFSPRNYFTASYGRHDFREVTLDSSGAIGGSQTLAYRLNGSFEDSHTFRDFSNIDQRFLSPSLLWRPTDATELLVTYEYFHDKRPLDRGVVSLSDGNGGRFIPNIPVSRRLGEAFEKREVTDNLLEVQLRHSWSENWSGILHLMHRRETGEQFHARPGQVFFGDPLVPDGTMLRSVDGIFDRVEKISNFYAHITGNFETGGLAHKLVFGAESRKWEQRGDFYGGDSEFVYADPDELIPLCVLDDSCFNIFDPVYGRLSGDLEYSNAFFRNEETSWGAFVRDRIEFTPRVALDLGVRYDGTRFKDYYEEPGFESDLEFRTAGQFSPQAGLLIRPRESLTLYASYAAGFLPSFTNDEETGETFDPQESRQYEVGLKSDFADGRVNFTLAAFQLVKDNIVEFLDEGPRLVGEVESKGIETSLVARPARGWNVIAGYSYVDAEITESGYDRGNRPGNVADSTFSLWTSYERQEGALAGLGFGAGVFYSADRFADSTNTWSLGGYTVVDAGVWYYVPVSFGGENSQIKWQLNAKNILDERYVASSGGDLRITPGTPRMILATVAYEF
jgi:iron complex outermembrane receptor protein